MSHLLNGLVARALSSVDRSDPNVAADKWSVAARELGLQHRPSRRRRNVGRMRGKRGDVTVSLFYKRDFLLCGAKHHHVGPPVVMSQRTSLIRDLVSLGRRGFKIGNPFFDDRVVVVSAKPEQVRAFLNPARRAAVLRLFEVWGDASISNHGVNIRHVCVADCEPIEIIRVVTFLVSIAEVLAEPKAVSEALTLQADGWLGDSIERLHEINEHGANPFTQRLEAEARIQHGEHRRGSEALPDPISTADEGWRKLANSPAPTHLPSPYQPLEAPSSNVEQHRVVHDLFGTFRPSFEIVRRFRHEYRNRTVTWRGTVLSASRFRHDSDFATGPGQKAIVLIGGAAWDLVLSNEVHAVVHLPRDAAVLDGAEIAFTGTLLHVDQFARKIYVAQGSLVERSGQPQDTNRG